MLRKLCTEKEKGFRGFELESGFSTAPTTTTVFIYTNIEEE
jgi:hypothetical protein